MRARSVVVGIAMVIVALVMFGHAQAQDEPIPVDLKVGETFDVCASGLIRCPPNDNKCDDPKVAIPVTASDGSGGLVFQGVGPGTTLCSALSVSGFRPIYRITVSPASQGDAEDNTLRLPAPKATDNALRLPAYPGRGGSAPKGRQKIMP
jgi:hypothetical protein